LHRSCEVFLVEDLAGSDDGEHNSLAKRQVPGSICRRMVTGVEVPIGMLSQSRHPDYGHLGRLADAERSRTGHSTPQVSRMVRLCSRMNCGR
jgi:hypothetical protein